MPLPAPKPPPPRKSRRSHERTIQRALLSRLATLLPPDAVVLHVPNEDATQSAAYGLAKIRDGAMPGCPDLLILHRGQAHWLELKRPEGTLSSAQISAHARLRASGCKVDVAYSVEDAVFSLREWGLVS